VISAVAIMKAGAEAEKLEGESTDAISAIAKAGIPVMGHLGMTPQSVHSFGGHKVQGKGDKGKSVIEAAKAVEQAGAFSVVLELIPAELASRVTAAISIPTIGIGAGVGCSGQIQVLHDVLGLTLHKFKHAKQYADGYHCFHRAMEQYTDEVRAGTFPASEHSF
jgi:3-methyl-2-oxobutanoate hydroxymethyltransferase